MHGICLGRGGGEGGPRHLNALCPCTGAATCVPACAIAGSYNPHHHPHNWPAVLCTPCHRCCCCYCQVATVVYVDSPAGTGMSYTPGTPPGTDYHSNDEATISDLGYFMEGLWERYPDLAARRLYIAGTLWRAYYSVGRR